MKRILVTGAAGFIGFHLSDRFLRSDVEVVGIDNLNDYYDVNLKLDRLDRLKRYANFSFEKLDLSDRDGMKHLFETNNFDRVINLAAQAGVRYSIENPHVYVESNVTGFINVLEGCRHSQVPHLVYASSSSVYGANTSMPFSVHDNVDHPMSLYAASKKTNELMAHSYANLYGLPSTGLRFFTVYGPWGRPDMALFLFTKAILEGKPIQVFNYGKMKRDFTYVDDIVEGIVRVSDHPPTGNDSWSGAMPDPGSSFAPYKVYNVGNNQPVELLRFVEAIENAIGKTAIKEMLPIQDGDVPETYADVTDLMNDVDFSPNTSIEDGIMQFVQWYRDYFNV